MSASRGGFGSPHVLRQRHPHVRRGCVHVCVRACISVRMGVYECADACVSLPAPMVFVCACVRALLRVRLRVRAQV